MSELTQSEKIYVAGVLEEIIKNTSDIVERGKASKVRMKIIDDIRRGNKNE